MVSFRNARKIISRMFRRAALSMNKDVYLSLELCFVWHIVGKCTFSKLFSDCVY